MKQLYPLKFEPIFIEKVWGGCKLNKLYNKQLGDKKKIGESWEISAVEDFVSVVKNGFLQGNSLDEIVEIYMGELVGDDIYIKYGDEFPLLIKFIDANEKLSIQVHPDNDTARYRHYAYGKTEMWYVVDAEPEAELVMGLKETISKKTLLEKIETNTLIESLNFEKVKNGDVFYIPSGRIHAIGKGIAVVEIQQTSDITYRLYDWDRMDLDGKPRELHIDLALQVAELSKKDSYKIQYTDFENERNKLVECPFFTTNLINLNADTEMNYSKLNSFVIYICLDGEFDIIYDDNRKVNVVKGETVLIPAEFDYLWLKPNKTAKIIETYIPFVYLDDEN